MSIQPIPPTSAPTTAGQLAARATQNDQILAAWLGDLESRSGTSEAEVLAILAGIRQRGPWSADLTYAPGDLVSHNDVLWYGVAAEPTTRTQHVPNPRFADTAAGWSNPRGAALSVTNGVLTYTGGPVNPSQVFLHSGEGSGWASPTVDGDVWSAAARIGLSAAAAGPVTIRLGVSFGPNLPSVYPDYNTITLQPGQTVRLESPPTPTPDGRTTAALSLRAHTSIPAATTLTISEPILEMAATVGDYFDGSMTDTPVATHAWTGTPDASPSIITETPSDITDEPGTSPRWAALGEAYPTPGDGGGGGPVGPEYQVTPESRLFTVPTMPNGSVPLAHGGLHDLYDDLVTAHPTYVTSTALGTDALGNELREYVFAEPPAPADFPLTKPRLGIITGVHGNEKSAAVALHRFLTALANVEGDNDTLRRFRAAIDIHVIPVVNPSGWDAGTRDNHNGVNINRNFTTDWSETEQNSGTGPASEVETQIVEAWMADDWHTLLDIHWSGQVGTRLTWAATAPTGTPENEAILRLYAGAMAQLGVYWPRRWPEFPTGVHVAEVFANRVARGTSRAHIGGLGHRGMLLETPDPVTYLDSGTKHRGASLTVVSEIVGNTLLGIMTDAY